MRFRIEPPAFPVYNRAGAVQRFDEGAVRPIVYGGFMESKLSRALAPKRPDAPTLTSRQLVKAWWQALRQPFFIVDLIPVGLGGALAARDLGYWHWGIFAVVVGGCF